MTKTGLIFASAITLICVAGCDTGNPSVDQAIGRGEVITGRTAQGAGVAIVTANDMRTKAVGGGLIAGGAAREEDGLARMSRADAAWGRESTPDEYMTAYDN